MSERTASPDYGHLTRAGEIQDAVADWSREAGQALENLKALGRAGEPGVEVQWKVTWFPPDEPEASKTGTEKAVRATAERHREWYPLIEHREVTVGEWVMER